MLTQLLIRNGTVVDTSPEPTVIGQRDVFITDDRITAVGPDLFAGPGVEVIDASGLIVLPGFVDTHRHVWEAGVRSAVPDTSLGGYVQRVLGEIAGRYRPEDVYAANLAGALECLDAGITTVLDWSHIQNSGAHTDSAVRALRDAGIRAVFGYCYGGPGGPADRATETHRVHREHFAAPGPLLSMALAASGPELTDEHTAAQEWRLARELDLPITVHLGGFGAASAARGLEFLRKSGLLGPRTTYIHPNHYTDDALRELAEHGGSASFSPLIEAALDIGYPATGRARTAGLPSSLSGDAVTSGPGDMFSLMRAAYALERARTDGSAFTTRDALRMATIEGAEVLGLAELTGSLRPGKQADLVLLRTDTFAMAPAHDPIAATVLSADTRAVDTVLVGGSVVKRDGVLCRGDLHTVLEAVRESGRQVARR